MATGSEEKSKDSEGKNFLKSSWGLGFLPVYQGPPGPELTVSKWEREWEGQGQDIHLLLPRFSGRQDPSPSCHSSLCTVIWWAFSDVQGPCPEALASPPMPHMRLGGWRQLPTKF